MKKRVLFLYLTKWSGHSAAAQALRAALEEKYPGVVCEESDFVSDAFPGLTATFKKAYVGVMKHFPTIWNYVYDNEYIETITKEFRVLFDAVHSGCVASDNSSRTFQYPLAGGAHVFFLFDYHMRYSVGTV